MNESEARFSMVKERHRETFEKAKKEGKADLPFIPLCDFIAGTEKFFTSSCCSGRTMLLGLEPGGGKKESFFHAKWHRKISFQEFWKEIGKKEKKGFELWLKSEPFILHIGTDSLKNAEKVLIAMKNSGVKRGGIIYARPGKFMIEVIGTQGFSLPVKGNGKLLVSREYLETLVEKANDKMGKNLERMKLFEKKCREIMK